MVIKNKIGKYNLKRLYPAMNLIPDQIMIKLQHLAALGRLPNLNNPKRFSDKIQWYKLNYRNPLMTICADKYQIRKFIAERGYSMNLNRLYGVYENFNQIDFNELPNSYAVKSNNGSGTNIFIKDNKKKDLFKIEKTILEWDEVDTLVIGREWAYKDIVPKIIIEELLKPDDEFQRKHGLNDYKFLCFNGEPKIVWVDINRETDHTRNFYNLNWEKIEIESDVPNYNGKIEEPDGFSEMITIARDLSKDFPFVRVDFYSINSRVYIGEMTFYPWSGIVKFNPDEFDFKLGQLFELP